VNSLSPPVPEELHAAVAERLRDDDHRYTAARRRLVDALARAGRPLTLPEIVAADPGLAQSSAYRNLDVMEHAGVIERISGGGDHTHFELAEPLLGHHHHLVCVDCGTIADIHLDEELERLVDRRLGVAAEAQGFAPLHHRLDLHGYCADCR
jgi:Fe2+ or Zn2+ uptake regulation protein